MNFPEICTPWSAAWRPEFVGTLLFVRRGDEVLLIEKKTGHGAGKINGPGGKIQSGESVLECAIRETREETGVCASEVSCRIEMRFVELDGPQWLGFGCVAQAFRGNPVNTREADPFWCDISQLPFSRMWPDDAIWLPEILKRDPGPPLVGNFLFEHGRLLAHEFVSEPSIWQDFPLG